MTDPMHRIACTTDLMTHCQYHTFGNPIIHTHNDHFNINGDTDAHTDVATAEPILAKPPLFVLIMHNDDYTTMEFVVMVLMMELNHSADDAYDLMLTIHHHGFAKVGLFPKEIAETKATRITELAESYDFPLLITLEPAD